MAKRAVAAQKNPDKPVTDLETFIQNVNKKDKRNGLKITFGFSKRKRK